MSMSRHCGGLTSTRKWTREKNRSFDGRRKCARLERPTRKVSWPANEKVWPVWGPPMTVSVTRITFRSVLVRFWGSGRFIMSRAAERLKRLAPETVARAIGAAQEEAVSRYNEGTGGLEKRR